MDELKCIYSRTKTIQEDKVSGFCPGCMHSTVIKLIGEVLDELDVVDKAVLITGIGCCGLHMDYIAYDTITAPHGRACAVATGLKRTNPDRAVFYIPGRRATLRPSVWQSLYPLQTAARILRLSSLITVFTA